MDRRAYLVAAGAGMASLAGCTAGARRTSGLAIDYRRDEPDGTQRTVAVAVGTYDPKEKFDSGGTPPTWELDTAYLEFYRLTSGDEVQPAVFVRNPGSYRLDVWIEQLARVGTNVEITEHGTLAERHRVSVTDDGVRHRTE